MAEKLVFTTPQQVASPAAEAMLIVLYKRRDPWIIRAEVKDETGRMREFTIEGNQGENLIKSLNKSNNTIKSEDRRVLEWLQSNTNPATGSPYLPAGTYEGTPD